MSKTVCRLFRYRALLATLTSRELKARYRGSVFGWAWSLANPLVLLVVYTFVFGLIFRGGRDQSIDPYSVFLVTGLFPWIWVQSSILEGASALLTNASLIRKATFPSELLPIVPVLSNLVHLGFTIPVIAFAFLAARYHWDYDIGGPTALLLPAVALLQLPLVAGCSLAFAALNAHFKDVKDLLNNVLTVMFFMTPILYSLPMLDSHPTVRAVVRANPVTPFTLAYQEVLFYGRVPTVWLWIEMAVISTVAWFLGALLYDRLRDTLVEAV